MAGERSTCGAHDLLVKAFDNLVEASNTNADRTLAKLDAIGGKFDKIAENLAAGTERMHSIESYVKDLHGIITRHDAELAAIRKRHETEDKRAADLEALKETCEFQRTAEIKKNFWGGSIRFGFVVVAACISAAVGYGAHMLSKKTAEVQHTAPVVQHGDK